MRSLLNVLISATILFLPLNLWAFEELHIAYVSISNVSEDLDGADLDGVKVAYVIWYQDHAPGLFLSGGLEYVETNSNDSVMRATVSLSTIIAGKGRFGFALKPILGFEYNDLDRSGFGVVTGGGIEVGFRPSARSQIALEYNWFKSIGGEDSQQVGLGFRWSFW